MGDHLTATRESETQPMLFQFDPFSDIDRQAGRSRPRPDPHSIPMDAVRRENKVELRFDLPGFTPGSVDLTVDKSVLKLTAEREPDTDDDTFLTHERWQGTRSRSLQLGEHLDPGALEASFLDGVLVVTIPISESAQPRKIDITGADSAQLENAA